MIIDYGNRTIGLKIVFFGPAMSGKTTAIQWLFTYLDCIDQLTSIENTLGRTMFCDFGTIPYSLGDGWIINAHVWSATGQDFYRSTREVVLVGADGIIFVADSRAHCLQHNIRSWNELKTMFSENFYNLPLVISLNKSDFGETQNITDHDFLKWVNISHFKCLSIKKTVAINGKGILDSFNRVITFIFPQLTLKMSITN